jgi:type I restriction enzyme R subunit
MKLLGSEVLKKMARELTDSLKKNTSIDWKLRESVRAKLRLMVKKLLKKYGYPPDKTAMATDLVLAQAETLSDKWSEQESQYKTDSKDDLKIAEKKAIYKTGRGSTTIMH